MRRRARSLAAAVVIAVVLPGVARAQSATVTLDTSASGRRQTIDGFGTCLSGTSAQRPWFEHLFLDDLRASILRFDLTPQFVSPYADLHYDSPWFGQAAPMNLPGPDGNNVRTYTGAADYGRSFGGHQAKIAVMGPDIDENVKLFDVTAPGPKTAGILAQAAEAAAPGQLKLVASIWSPAPWLKVSSGDTIRGQSGALPKNGTPWPFIWGGNFSGGLLDTSGTPRAEFDDSSLGGTGPTSALTQFARGLAAYLRAFQDAYGVKLYAVSLQNELGFEEFYSSCAYPKAAGYIKVLEAARAELDRYPDLEGIRLMGPEDVLGGGPYGMWQYGAGATATDKNLQYLAKIAKVPAAEKALSFFCIHGYASDGVASAGAAPTQWSWWRNGWTASPAAGLPATVKGFASYGKKSWMTETSGEQTSWLAPASGFPGKGAFGIDLEIEQALTAGDESAWLYWQLSDGKAVGAETLTDQSLGSSSPKYVAAKHFFRFIRPGAVRVATTVVGPTGLSASAYLRDADHSLVVELVNATSAPVSTAVAIPADPPGLSHFQVVTSSAGRLWQTGAADASGGRVTVSVPAYGIATLAGTGTTLGGADGGVGDGGTTPDGGPATPDGGAGATGSAAGPGCGCGASGGGPESLAFVLLLALGIRFAGRPRDT